MANTKKNPLQGLGLEVQKKGTTSDGNAPNTSCGHTASNCGK